jgi:hypothetical protein
MNGKLVEEAPKRLNGLHQISVLLSYLLNVVLEDTHLPLRLRFILTKLFLR